MPAKTQPRAGRGDMIGGALARSFDQNWQIFEILAVPRRKRLKQLQAVASGIDNHFDIFSGSRRFEIAGNLARKTLLRQFRSYRWNELKRLAVFTLQFIF